MGSSSLGKFLKKQDAFGQAVTINYKGEDVYTTTWGAFLTLVQKIFILVVAMIGMLDLFAYKDPNITQYSIFDKRSDNQEFNFEENYGGFIIGL